MVAEEKDLLLCNSSSTQWICSESLSPLASKYPQNHSDCLWTALWAAFPAFHLSSESVIKVNVAFSAISLPLSKLLIEFGCYLKQHLPFKHYINFMHKRKMCKLLSVRRGRTGRRSSCVGLANVWCHQYSFTWNVTGVELDSCQVLFGHSVLVL